MKEKIIFKNNSIILEYYNPSNNEFTSEEIKIGEIDIINNLFDCIVEFDKDLTVEGFLKNIEPYIEDIQYHLTSFIGNFNLKQFFDLLNQPSTITKEEKKDFHKHISHVEMFWNCEIWETINKIKESEFILWGGYHGISKKDGINYSFGLTPLNNWKHYKFSLNTELICYRNTEELLKEEVFKSELKWTLHDLLKNFFYELTFYGSLTDIEEFKKELEESLNNIKNNSESLKTISLEEFKIDILEKELTSFLEKEEYENAAKIKSKIQELKDKIKKN